MRLVTEEAGILRSGMWVLEGEAFLDCFMAREAQFLRFFDQQVLAAAVVGGVASEAFFG